MKTIELKIRNHSLLIVALVFAALTFSCGSNTENQSEKTSNESIDPTQNSIDLTSLQFNSGGMKLGAMSEQEFNTVVKANGLFAVPPQNRAEVSAYFAGYVKDLYLLPGDAVRKGEVLFTIENPEYVQIQQDFLEAKGRLAYLKSNYERQKELLADNVTSQKNFLKAESEYNVTLAQYQSFKKKLSLMNIDSDHLSGESLQSVIEVLSPISGYATTVHASKGMYLNPSDKAITVTNIDDLHLELKIFEKDLPQIQKGQLIHFQLQSNNQKTYQGKVHLVNRAIDEQERTVEIHGDLVHESETKLFAPGMYIEAEIITQSEKGWALPQDAIVLVDETHYVLVKQSETTFVKKPVHIGATYHGYTQILNFQDFPLNTQFLTVGAFNLITE